MRTRTRPTGVPMRVRALAGAVDTLIIVVPCVAAVAGWTAWAGRGQDEPQKDWREEHRPAIERIARFTWVLRIVAVALRNVPSPGARLVGIRTVDARTGGPVSRRSAAIGQLADLGYARLIRLASAPWWRPQKRRLENVRRRTKAFQAAHPDADWRTAPELAADSREAWGSCLRILALVVVTGSLRPLSARLSPRRQTLVDRLGGVVVVRARR